MAASYDSVFLLNVQQLALAPLFGPYPQAYRASQLRSLRRDLADLITGRITSLVAFLYCHLMATQRPSGVCFVLVLEAVWQLVSSQPAVVMDSRLWNFCAGVWV